MSGILRIDKLPDGGVILRDLPGTDRAIPLTSAEARMLGRDLATAGGDQFEASVAELGSIDSYRVDWLAVIVDSE